MGYGWGYALSRYGVSYEQKMKKKMKKIKELDRVALLRDFPDEVLKTGDPGTVVHVYIDGRLEVEFVDREGYVVGLRSFSPSDVRMATAADDDIRAVGCRDLFYGPVESPAPR